LDYNFRGPAVERPKIGIPYSYFFLQPLKMATSSVVHTSGSLTSKTTLGPNLAGGWGREHPQNFGTPTYFCNRWI